MSTSQRSEGAGHAKSNKKIVVVLLNTKRDMEICRVSIILCGGQSLCLASLLSCCCCSHLQADSDTVHYLDNNAPPPYHRTTQTSWPCHLYDLVGNIWFLYVSYVGLHPQKQMCRFWYGSPSSSFPSSHTYDACDASPQACRRKLLSCMPSCSASFSRNPSSLHAGATLWSLPVPQLQQQQQQPYYPKARARQKKLLP